MAGPLPNVPPQLAAYLKRYQEDPTSRVFAPLAEAYRKAGLVDEAIEIAQEGLRLHPNFIGGKVALARALFEKKRFEEVVQTLEPMIHDIPDNLIAQRLLAESYLMLGRTAESLACFKMLLYFSPQDADTAQLVRELEAQAYQSGNLVLQTDFQEKPVYQAIEDSPDEKRKLWIRRIELLQNALANVAAYRATPRRNRQSNASS